MKNDEETGGNTAAGAVRLNKYLADCGVASRRRCDELIAAGKVSIAGQPVTRLGTRVDPSRQAIEVDGVVLQPAPPRRSYYLLNKPRGVICTNDPRESRPRAIDLVTDRRKGRIYTVGRLDEDSEGLVILTNDGDFAQRIAHPRYEIPKTYRVQVRGKVEREPLDRIRAGVRLAEGRTGRVRVYVQRSSPKLSTVIVTLHEGKNREVRRIFAKVGYVVVSLRRIRIGDITDRRLKAGHWRLLTTGEVRALLALSDAEPEPVSERPRTSRPRKSDASSREAAGGRRARRGVERPRGPRDAREDSRPRSGAARRGRTAEHRDVELRPARTPLRKKAGARKQAGEVRSEVLQRRLGKAKKGADKGAPTRLGRKRKKA